MGLTPSAASQPLLSADRCEGRKGVIEPVVPVGVMPRSGAGHDLFAELASVPTHDHLGDLVAPAAPGLHTPVAL